MKHVVALFQEAGAEWIQDKASRHGAALAYYSVFSIGPLLLIVTAVAALVFGQESVDSRVTSELQAFLGKDGAAVLIDLLRGANKNKSGGLIATVIGVCLLLFSASGVVYQLKSSLNEMWHLAPDPERPIWWVLRDRLLSLAAVLGLGFLLVVSLAVSALASAFSDSIQHWIQLPPVLFQCLRMGISLGVLTLFFLLMFRYLPDAKVSWYDAGVGALVTAVLFTLGKWLIGWYLGNKSLSSTYGAAGSLMVVLLWVYYTSQILFFGAEVTQVHARRYGERIKPGPQTVRGVDYAKSAEEIEAEEEHALQMAQHRPLPEHPPKV